MAGHITAARSLPAMTLRQDRILNEIYDFRNKDGTLIVLYDADERLREAAKAAMVLVDRGFANTCVVFSFFLSSRLVRSRPSIFLSSSSPIFKYSLLCLSQALLLSPYFQVRAGQGTGGVRGALPVLCGGGSAGAAGRIVIAGQPEGRRRRRRRR